MSLSYDEKFGHLGNEEEQEENAARAKDVERFKSELKSLRHHGDGGENSSDDDDDDDDLHPLFWTKPPSQRKNAKPQAKHMEEILTNMVYEDKSPPALAEEFKQRGNEAFRQGRLKDAIGWYAESFDWNRQANKSDEFDPEAFASVLYSNRAAVHLKLKNFRTALKDALKSLTIASSDKAKFRAAQAYIGLERPHDALLYLPPPTPQDDKSVVSQVRNQAETMILKLEAAARARDAAQAQKLAQDEQLRALYRQSGFRIGPLNMDLHHYTGSNERAGEHGPIPQVEGGVLQWPTVFMYPEHSQSDFVQSFAETATLADVLATMFPSSQTSNVPFAPWDKSRQYEMANLEVYFCERAAKPYDLTKPLYTQQGKESGNGDDDNDAHDGGVQRADRLKARKWIRVPLDKTLAQAMRHPSYVIPGLAVFLVVSRNNTFYKSWMEQCMKDGGVIEFTMS